MAFDLSGAPVFYEDCDPARASLFDLELDEAARARALERRAVRGRCNFTAVETTFSLSSDNFREDLVSHATGSINRHRQVVCALSLALLASPHASLAEIATHINRRRLRLYLAEANSALFQFFTAHLDPALFTCSEYFGERHQSGALVGEVVHQDLQRTSFADESFDIVITCEVFEHIPDALAAEREVVRILRPGGLYCFTVPFSHEGEQDLVLAEKTADSEIKYFAEPQYHGDPLRPDEGILVYRIFTFRDLKRRFESLGCQFRSYRFWSSALGILGDNSWVHVVRKNHGDAGDAAESGVEDLWLAHHREEAIAKHTRILESELARREAELVAARRQLAKREDVLRWMQTSRSWRALSSLRRLRELAEGWRRLGGRLGLHGGEEFRGVLE